MADSNNHSHPAPGPKRILIVEDVEAMHSALLHLCYNKESWETSTAPDGKTALEMIRGERYDLVLLHDLMRGKHGFATCPAIREFSNVPIVILIVGYLSSYGVNAVRAYEAGADGYIFKPFTLKPLVDCVTTILRGERPNAHTFDESGWGTFKRK